VAAFWLNGFGPGIIKLYGVTSHVAVGANSHDGAVTFWLMQNANGLGPRMGVTRETDASYAGGAVFSFGWFHVRGDRWPTGQLRMISAPGWLWVLATAILPAIWFAAVVHRRRRPNPHQCDHCGYDLTGNVSGLCPECGTELSEQRS